MSISDLTKLVHPPSNPKDVPQKKNWDIIEKKLKHKLPDDYKKYIETYGSGLLGNFIIVLNPFSKSEGIELFSGIKILSTTLHELKRVEGDEYIPYEVYPTSPGLLPWGSDENGNGLYWLTRNEPDKWPCIIGGGRDKRWEEYKMPMTVFLSKALKGELKSKIWPKSFPDIRKDHDFIAY